MLNDFDVQTFSGHLALCITGRSIGGQIAFPLIQSGESIENAAPARTEARVAIDEDGRTSNEAIRKVWLMIGTQN